MTEQLPIIHKTGAIDKKATGSCSLLGRGLAAIQHKETGVVLADLDSRYQQARDIYNRVTDYGEESRFKVELLPTQEELLKEPLLKHLQPFYNLMKQLADVFAVFQELANQGYGRAYLPLSNMYRGGQGIHEDIEKALYYSRLAFNWYFNNQISDDLETWNDLGWIYKTGRGVEQDYRQAGFWYSKAAKRGHSDAQYNLGWICACGHGVEQDDEQAVFWYLKAAEQCHARAQYTLGWTYQYECEDDDELAVFWYKESAELGHASAQLSLGCMYQNGCGVEDNDEQAVFWYSKAAVQGDKEAQDNLGWMYENGRGVEEDDELAVFWYNEAAKQGDASAQYNLGLMYDNGQYDNGQGVEQDDELAVFWYRKAAEQGHANAQNNLGMMYQFGRGVEQDDELAVFWYNEAVEQGYASAQCNLGWMYANGRGVEQDTQQAIFWYRKAIKQGHRNAQNNLDLLCAITHSEDYLKAMKHLLVGQPDDWYVLANHFGYGFRVQLKELLSENIMDERLIPFFNAIALKPVLISNETDLLAVATLQGRLLIFPVSELPMLENGKSNKLIQIPITDLSNGTDSVVVMVILSENSHLKITSGKRFVILKSIDIQVYTSSCAEKGLPLPRGFKRVDGMECVD